MRTITVALLILATQITIGQTNHRERPLTIREAWAGNRHSAAIQINQPIIGAWGYKLGETLNTTNSSLTFLGKGIYTFTPTNDFRHFDTFAIATTPHKKIVAIHASRMFDTSDSDGCQKELAILIQLYTDKYGTPFSTGQNFGNDPSTVTLYVEHSRRIAIHQFLHPLRITISYEDEALAEEDLKGIAADEAITNKARLDAAKKQTLIILG
ncbi:MAG: hypothetical protein ACLQU4_11265 [Limisphaerales bacterium]